MSLADSAPQGSPEDVAPGAARRGTYAEIGEKLPMSIKLAYGMPNFAGAGLSLIHI
mgnify:CR=1 FL=1